jgi:alpha-1,2-mannosyltransferase
LEGIAPIAIVAACAFFYIKPNVLDPISGLGAPSDFAVYYQAAKDILSGTSPYENSAYFYPPSVAFLMAPFGLIPYVTARWIWFLLSHVLFLSSGWLVWRAAGRGLIALCCIACVWALGGAAKEVFDVGQLSFLLMLALAAAFTQGTRLRGVAVGFGWALKYFPGVLAMAFVLQRNWRGLRTAIGVVVLATGIPWLLIACAFAGPKAPGSARYWMGTPSLFSWSIPSVVLRVLDPLRTSGPLPSEWEFGNVAASLHLTARLQFLSAGTALFVLAAGAIALTLVCRGRLRRAQASWAMLGLLSLSLAAAPVCWSHYQVLQYPGVALMLVSAIRVRAWRIAVAVAVCFAFAYRLPELALCAYHDKYAGWSAASPATLYFWSSVAPLAGVGLFGLALWNVKQSGPKSDRIPDISLTSAFLEPRVNSGERKAARRPDMGVRSSRQSLARPKR